MFAESAGVLIGAARHLSDPDRDVLIVDVMSTEAVDTSAIEGERLDRDSVQSSIHRQLGLAADRDGSPAEVGIAELMVALFRSLAAPLDDEMLFAWHRMVMRGRDLSDIGRYRTHPQAMQIISGRPSSPRITSKRRRPFKSSARRIGSWRGSLRPARRGRARSLRSPARGWRISGSKASIPSRTATGASAAPLPRKLGSRALHASFDSHCQHVAAASQGLLPGAGGCEPNARGDGLAPVVRARGDRGAATGPARRRVHPA